MANEPRITPDYVRSRFKYFPESGHLFWKPIAAKRCAAAWNARFADTMAGRIDSTGYLQVAIDGKRYPATHLIWLIWLALGLGMLSIIVTAPGQTIAG